jgi:hypothetical protein
MKKTGIAMFILGIILTVLSGFDMLTREKIIDFGRVQVIHQKRHNINWSPLAGVVVMVVGAGVYLYGRKNTLYISK